MACRWGRTAAACCRREAGRRRRCQFRKIRSKRDAGQLAALLSQDELKQAGELLITQLDGALRSRDLVSHLEQHVIRKQRRLAQVDEQGGTDHKSATLTRAGGVDLVPATGDQLGCAAAPAVWRRDAV